MREWRCVLYRECKRVGMENRQSVLEINPDPRRPPGERSEGEMNMKRLQVTVKSEFHNRIAIMLAKSYDGYTHQLTSRQQYNAHQKVCGVSGCLCPVDYFSADGHKLALTCIYSDGSEDYVDALLV
jgi:hypothetical protein